MTLVPLSGAIPGGPELLVVLLMMLFMLFPLGLAIWVANDARGRTDHPLAWGIATLIAGFSPFFVGAVAVATLYYVVRDELGSTAPPTFSESDMDESAQVLGEPLGGEKEELEPEEKLQSESEARAETGAEEAEGQDEDFEFGNHPPEEVEAEAEAGSGEGGESGEGSESDENGDESTEGPTEETPDLSGDEDGKGDEKAE